MRGTVEVNRYLIERDIPHEFFRLEGMIHNASEIPGALGLAPGEVVAVRGFEYRNKVLLAIAGMDLEPSLDLVAEAARVSRVRPAQPSAVSRVTGYPAEWAPPIGHERAVTTLMDKNVLTFEVVYAPAGEPSVVLKIRSEDLVRATGATPALLGELGAIGS
jgi:prolyl-tRNA editing enzyme YbaK/EbsC (Cys-tRNA(Pro) deacylase)